MSSFFSKNTRELDTVLTRTVDSLTTNEQANDALNNWALIYISTKYNQNIPKGIQVTERTRGFMPTPTGSVPKTICPPPPLLVGVGGHNYEDCNLKTINCLTEHVNGYMW